jgi:TonB family protein
MNLIKPRTKTRPAKPSSLALLPSLAGAALLLLLPSPLLHAADGDSRKVITHIAPTYPEMAKRMHVSGTVHLDATVSPDGHVEKVKATAGHPLLCTAAQDALLRWKFAPGPTESVVSVQINFSDGESK